jgi:hypothetical protein
MLHDVYSQNMQEKVGVDMLVQEHDSVQIRHPVDFRLPK